MIANANGGHHAGSSTNAPCALEHIHSAGASRKEKEQGVSLGTALGKGQTPVRLEAMLPWLSKYPARDKAELLKKGFRDGFRIPGREGTQGGQLKNLKSANTNPGLVIEKLYKEVSLGRMAGPFKEPPLHNLRTSPLGLVPKKEAGKFRLIHHLSHPKGTSVNDEIDKDLVKVSYTSFDEAIRLVGRAGRGALMAKADIESAFRLLPVHPESLHLLGCYFEGHYYVDRSLPMGCSISCAYFEAFSTFLEWVVREKAGVASVIHYLDDFLCVGPQRSSLCAVLLETLQEVAEQFGVPLAREKTEGPITCLKFLGIEIDTVRQECRLPMDKVLTLKEEVGYAKQAKKVTLKQLQSLLGKLNFACRIIPMGRVFSRSLSMATAGIRHPHHFIRLNSEHKADLAVWSTFLQDFNGKVYWPEEVVENPEISLFTDAAGATGFGAYLSGKWCAAGWPQEWATRNLTGNLAFLELFPIIVAVELWGRELSNKSVLFRSDNMATVLAVNNLTSSSRPVLALLRHLVLRCLQLNISFRAKHIPGEINEIADALSRFQWNRFRGLAPAAEQEGERCPDLVWNLVPQMPSSAKYG
ncbi:uncharacterized protein LOC116407638 [Xenopus tropicalis]|uniref:ribonuclease H n=1 Tax=Xenopus tropicalis TaxID=8364 RepID=A0A8J1IWR7_XENTR|nr:uncharacterized protein LOC116407638 [Xenopus tropicalis]